MFKDEDGRAAVRIARAYIEEKLGGEIASLPDDPPVFRESSGVFVTLNTFPERELRGCIGYSEPVKALGKALREVALAAATHDPRFPPVSLREMGGIVIDVTVLTAPERISYKGPEDLVSKIVIGRDGLIAKRSFMSGLLLPQVPVEWGWTVEEFLTHTCRKAGLSGNEWKRGEVEFLRFSGIVFGEASPRGEVREERLGRG